MLAIAFSTPRLEPIEPLLTRSHPYFRDQISVSTRRVTVRKKEKEKKKKKSVSSGAKERRGSLVNSCHLSSEPPGSHWGSLQAIHHSTCMQVTHTTARELFFLQQRAQIVQLQFSCSLFLSESDGTCRATEKRYIWFVCYRCFCWPFRLPAPSACLMVKWQIQSNKI